MLPILKNKVLAVAQMYILKEVCERLDRIEIDGILESGPMIKNSMLILVDHANKR